MTKKKALTAAIAVIAVVLFIAAGVLIYRNTLPDSYSSRLTEDPETFLKFTVQKKAVSSAVSSKVSSSSQPPAQVAVFLSSVKDSIAASQYAVKKLESELSQEIEAGRLLRFDGPWAVPMGAGSVAEDEFQSVVGYTVYFGDGKGSAGFRSEVICSLTMKRKEGGGYTENKEERSYEVLGDGRFDNFSWIIDHPLRGAGRKVRRFRQKPGRDRFDAVQAVDGYSEGLEHQRQDLCGYKI